MYLPKYSPLRKVLIFCLYVKRGQIQRLQKWTDSCSKRPFQGLSPPNFCDRFFKFFASCYSPIWNVSKCYSKASKRNEFKRTLKINHIYTTQVLSIKKKLLQLKIHKIIIRHNSFHQIIHYYNTLLKTE